MKKLILFVAMLFIISLNVNVYANDSKHTPNVNAKGAILMDFNSGRVLWEKNSSEPLAMASTTKIMTGVLALELGNLKDIVTVSKRAALTPPVKMNLQTGEKIRLEDLLHALMLQSSNDAAVAIAEHIGGSVENFCKLMTDKASEIGASNTVFKTPNGLDLEDHHSTAHDLAIIARYALSNTDFVKIITTKEVHLPISGGDFRQYYVSNKNRLLHEYPGAFGVKTGFTGKAGHCFVGAAKKNNMELISVVLASGWGASGKEQKWIDTKKILNFGFENYSVETIAHKDTHIKEIEVLHSREKKVGLKLSNNFSITISDDEKDDINFKVSAPSVVDSPVKKGSVLGSVKYYIGDEFVSEISLVTENNIDRHDFNTSLKKILHSWFAQ